MACTFSLVRKESSQLSTVPRQSRPSSASFLASGTFSIIQPILAAGKYGERFRPVRARTVSAMSESRSQTASALAHCQTMASQMLFPVSRSQATVVSRWFEMPKAAMLPLSIPAFSTVSRQTARVFRLISSGSWLTQPRGLIICLCGRSARQTSSPSSLNSRPFVPCVDWSTASMYRLI